ncbi:MAG: hypothetical protein LR015_04955 [Verrucomicrobia bacterium]|nr:hypothetical protein [Verrucomicrobiota bacterium]
MPRPPDIPGLLLSFFNWGVYFKYYQRILLHSIGRMAEDERTFIPETEFPKVYARARIYVAIYLAVILVSIAVGSVLPLLLVGLTNFFWQLVDANLRVHSTCGTCGKRFGPQAELSHLLY